MSKFTPSLQPNYTMLNDSVIRAAAIRIQVALSTEWQRPGNAVTTLSGDGVTTVADSYICNKLIRAIESSNEEQPDWKEHVLDPMLSSCLSTYEAIDKETQGIIQTVAVVLLAYDIIRQRNAVLIQADYAFVKSTFDEFLTRNAMIAIRATVNNESERCSGLDANMGKLNGLFSLEAVLSEAIQRAGTDDIVTQVVSTPVSAEPIEPPMPTSRTINAEALLPQPQNATPRDVHIQYYLKPTCALSVDRVTSIDCPNEVLVLETSDGRRVCIEEGVIVSQVEDRRRRVQVQAPQADGFDLSATMILPPDASYVVDDVSSVERVDEMADCMWVVFETPTATVWVGNGQYTYEKIGKAVFVKNVFNICSTV